MGGKERLIPPRTNDKTWVLLTGGAGFLGAALVHALISRGHNVICLIRAATPQVARQRVVRALQPWTNDAERLLESGKVAALRADLHLPGCGLDTGVREKLRGRISRVVHAAGSTRFSKTSTGEPHRTNVDGTRHILELAATLECREWHIISTAYVAGAQERALEAVADTPPPARNAYEDSKWKMERIALGQARMHNASVTIYRPSIIVGHSKTGQASRFVGLYYLFRATSMLARAAEEKADVDRHALPIRISATPGGCPNIICIDDVARMFCDIFETQAAHGGVYHLTHPAPPTNAEIKRVLEQYYDVAGGRFVDGPPGRGDRSGSENDTTRLFQDLFDDMTVQVHDYLFDAPQFDRARVARVITRPPAEWTDDRLRRLIETAESAGWRATDPDRQETGDIREIATYFQEFLPSHITGSKLGDAEGVDVRVCFVIGRHPEGRWWCSFRGGRVEAVEPAGEQPVEVVYRTSETRFWAAVAGEMSGAELFLSGEAHIEGDVERALKFAVMLEDFVKQHPYRRRGTHRTEDAFAERE